LSPRIEISSPREDKADIPFAIYRTTYKDPLGTTRTWESAERRTRPKGSEIDGVGIIALLEKKDGVYSFLGIA
jgi:hypothetical protein